MGLFDQFISVDIKKNMGIAGLTDEFFCVYLNNLFEKYNKNILIVVNSLYEANQLYSSMKNYTDSCCLFPMDDFLTSEALAISPDLQITRLETINEIIKNDNYSFDKSINLKELKKLNYFAKEDDISLLRLKFLNSKAGEINKENIVAFKFKYNDIDYEISSKGIKKI